MRKKLTLVREFNAEVAERVMGWRWRKSSVNGCRALFSDNNVALPWFADLASGDEPICSEQHWAVPRYSIDIADALKVVEHRIRTASEIGCDYHMSYDCFSRTWVVTESLGGRAFDSPAVATLPHAICLAALRAVDGLKKLTGAVEQRAFTKGERWGTAVSVNARLSFPDKFTLGESTKYEPMLVDDEEFERRARNAAESEGEREGAKSTITFSNGDSLKGLKGWEDEE